MSIDSHGTDYSLELDDPILGVVVADIVELIRRETACTAVCLAAALNTGLEDPYRQNEIAAELYRHVYAIASKRWMNEGHPYVAGVLGPLGLDDMQFVNALYVIEAEYRATSTTVASAVRELVYIGVADPAVAEGMLQQLDTLVPRLAGHAVMDNDTLISLQLVIDETCRETRDVISGELRLVVGRPD